MNEVSQGDIDELVSLTNQVVGALNANDKNEANRLFNAWRDKFEHRPEVFTKSTEIMNVMAMVGYNLAYPELPALLARYSGSTAKDLNDIFSFLVSMGPATMVDVGAQWGTVLHPYAWSGWLVLAFEPMDDSREKMKERVSAFRNVIVDTRAVSNEVKAGVKFYQGTETNVRSLHGAHESEENERITVEVDVTTLTAALGEHEIDHVMFLKIDVEGHELDVLKGVPWDTMTPVVIAAEYDNPITVKLGYTHEDILKYLNDKGYQVVISEWEPIVTYGSGHKWVRYTLDPDDIHPESWGNLFAFANPQDFDRFAAKHLDQVTSRDG